MSVQFTCPHCTQLMSAPRQKIGEVVRCAACGGGVVVPQPLQNELDPSADANAQTHHSAAEELNHEMLRESSLRESAVGTETEEDFRHSPRVATFGELSSAIPVTRFALYSIGGLIVGVALISFLLGWAMGQGSVQTQFGAMANAQRHRIYGRVAFTTGQGRNAPDTESVVVALPRRRKPDEKLTINSIRPDAAPPNSQDPTVRGIREIGGDVVRTDALGEYELDVSEAGEYYLLILSSHVARASNRPPLTNEIVELGQYFKQADTLLGQNDYVWTKHLVRTDKKYDYSFSGE